MRAKCWDTWMSSTVPGTMSYFVNVTSKTFHTLLGLPTLPASHQAGTNFSQDTFVPYPACGNNRWWKEQKWIEVGGKVIQIQWNIRKSFNQRWSKIAEGFSFFFPQPLLKAAASYSPLNVPLYKMPPSEMCWGRVIGDCHHISDPWGREAAKLLRWFLCLCSLTETQGEEGGSSWGSKASPAVLKLC